MQKKPFSLKAKVGVYVLLFLFLMFSIAPNVTSAAEDVPTDDTLGAKVAQAETGAGGAAAGEAAAGVAAAGASSGLSAATIAAIALGVAAAAVGIAAVAGSNDDSGAVTPTTHRP